MFLNIDPLYIVYGQLDAENYMTYQLNVTPNQDMNNSHSNIENYEIVQFIVVEQV